MSARNESFGKLCEWLEEHEAAFDAPYGIVESTIPGKHPGAIIAYTVTFGCCRTWDATATVYGTDKVTLESRGHFTRLNGPYKSVENLIATLDYEFIRPF
jgi:hypothetical protein